MDTTTTASSNVFQDEWLLMSELEKKLYENLFSKFKNADHETKKSVADCLRRLVVHPLLLTELDSKQQTLLFQDIDSEIISPLMNDSSFISTKLQFICTSILTRLSENRTAKILVCSEFESFLTLLRDNLLKSQFSDKICHDVNLWDPSNPLFKESASKFTKSDQKVLFCKIKSDLENNNLTLYGSFFPNIDTIYFCEAVNSYTVFQKFFQQFTQPVTVYRPLMKNTIEEIMEVYCKKSIAKNNE